MRTLLRPPMSLRALPMALLLCGAGPLAHAQADSEAVASGSAEAELATVRVIGRASYAPL